MPAYIREIPVTQPTPRVGILVVAYNAETTLEATLDRIPADFRPRLTEIMICDDASRDGTQSAALRWRDSHPETSTMVVKQLKNLGYGGNQKAGYQMAIERGLDIVVLLHGDGQYAPECLPDIVAPLVEGRADAVFGSRMMVPGAARAGGMPPYKFVGNKILTRAENVLLGLSLSEFHSGYRAYRVEALRALPFAENSDGFDFDTQIIIQLVDAGRRIVEVPIPTYYGDEICYVEGMKYARDVMRDVVQYRLTKAGFGTHPWVPTEAEYELKESEGSSHTRILQMLESRPPGRILDVGCSGGRFGELLRRRGHHVTGLDSVEILGVHLRLDEFILVDLEHGLPKQVSGNYDVIVAADVIEHVSAPVDLLRQLTQMLAPGGEIIISTPNFGHWYSRGRVALGIFDYDRRGILDNTHLRFFMRRGLRRTVREAKLVIAELRYSGLPLSAVTEGHSTATRTVRAVDKALVKLRPTLFGYQFVARLRPDRS